jgi:hypothetical protein
MYQDDVRFLRNHTDVIELADPRGPGRLAVCPRFQGRVMTSTASGPDGPGFGWIHRDFIASGRVDPKINVTGGEDRFWLGPEGGPYSLFFPPGSPFDFEHWTVPAPLDREPFSVADASADRVSFHREMSLTRHSGAALEIGVIREVRVLPAFSLHREFGLEADTRVAAVAFESANTIRNTGRTAWNRETGMPSIWILGMFQPSPDVTAILPYRDGPLTDLGPVVNDDYFGQIPPDRLRTGKGAVYFRCDGKLRGKIGLSPKRARPVLGSHDAAGGTLTIVQFTLPDGEPAYVNSAWSLQADPFSGDTVNAYNDGPVSPGGPPLGPFYELETSSPAAGLAPGCSLTHVHRTIHLSGTNAELDAVARRVLGVGLEAARSAFR